MKQVAKVPISAIAYSIYVRQAQDASTEVYTLDYGDSLRVFDVRGNPRSSRKWTSRVRCIAVGDIEGQGDDAVVGGVGKRLLIIDKRGKPIWNINLESTVISCDARDIDGDDAAEVVVAMQNKRVVLWNHDKEALFSRTFDETITDVWLEDITNDSELEVIVADRKGFVRILTAAGYQIQELKLGESITVFGILVFGKRKFFITGDHTEILKIWDIDGNQVSTIELPDNPKALATGVPDDISNVTYLVVSTGDRNLQFWVAQESVSVPNSEKITLQQIESTKTEIYRRVIKCGNCGAPASPESPRCESCGSVLEILDEYQLDEFIREALESVTSKHNRIELKELDRILRRTLPRPAAYNLRKSLQTMIKKQIIDGYFDRSFFIVTESKKIDIPKGISSSDISQARKTLTELLSNQRTIDVMKMERETGISAKILRRTLLILLGEGLVQGVLSGNVFALDQKQDPKAFAKHLDEELKSWL